MEEEGYVLEFDMLETAKDLAMAKQITIAEALLIILINEVMKLHFHIEHLDPKTEKEE